jgi:hypothetical protein
MKLAVNKEQLIVASTGDSLLIDDLQSIVRIRSQIRRDAQRWARQGLVFEGVSCDRVETTDDVYIVRGSGYELRTTRRDGFWSVDALQKAASDEWTEHATSPTRSVEQQPE